MCAARVLICVCVADSFAWLPANHLAIFPQTRLSDASPVLQCVRLEPQGQLVFAREAEATLAGAGSAPNFCAAAGWLGVHAQQWCDSPRCQGAIGRAFNR